MSRGNRRTSPPQTTSQPQEHATPIRDEGLIKQFLENQGKQLDLQVYEAKLKEKEIENSHEVAKESLRLQSANETQVGQNKLKSQKYQYTFWGCVFFLFFFLLGLTICLNKEAMALEILKVIVPAIVSAIGSYYYGLHKGASKSSKSNYQTIEDIEPED